jgi:pimeloyl-ACP methyl ester carboxylesterase
MDYRKPAGPRLAIALLRKATSTPDALPLVFNPGGPGGSGTDWVAANGSLLVNPASPDITAQMTLVGMDPRGVGRSTQLNCVSAEFLAAQNQGLPDTVAEQLAFAADIPLNEVCATTNKGLTSNIGTDSVARDLDIVRAALGQPKLNYYGASYGSYLGMMYAHTFPDRVGRMVLDGINSPFPDMTVLATAQAVGTESLLRAWADSCASRGPSCPAGPGKNRREVMAWLDNLLLILRDAPLEQDIGRAITDRTILDIAVDLLSVGQGSGFADLDALLTAAASRNVDGVNAFTSDDGQDHAYAASVNQAVNCYDRPTDGRLKDTVALDRRLSAQRLAPHFAALFAPIPATCFHWKVRKGKPNLVVSPTTTAPVLFINGRNDPKTPYRMAQASIPLFPHAGLLVWDGFGHVSGTRGNACINDAVAAYLVGATLPPRRGATCPS